jgi:hypothetical protein
VAFIRAVCFLYHKSFFSLFLLSFRIPQERSMVLKSHLVSVTRLHVLFNHFPLCVDFDDSNIDRLLATIREPQSAARSSGSSCFSFFDSLFLFIYDLFDNTVSSSGPATSRDGMIPE